MRLFGPSPYTVSRRAEFRRDCYRASARLGRHSRAPDMTTLKGQPERAISARRYNNDSGTKGLSSHDFTRSQRVESGSSVITISWSSSELSHSQPTPLAARRTR
jgi:hypothetical protein